MVFALLQDKRELLFKEYPYLLQEINLKFKEEIIKALPDVKFRFVDPLSLSVSCHIGPGALAIAICKDNLA